MLTSRYLFTEEALMFGQTNGEFWDIVGTPRNFEAADHQKQNGSSDLDKLIISGYPTPIQSDFCISLLFDNCSTAEGACMDIETTSNSTGYALAHQVMYMQIARQVTASIHYTLPL